MIHNVGDIKTTIDHVSDSLRESREQLDTKVMIKRVQDMMTALAPFRPSTIDDTASNITSGVGNALSSVKHASTPQMNYESVLTAPPGQFLRTPGNNSFNSTTVKTGPTNFLHKR